MTRRIGGGVGAVRLVAATAVAVVLAGLSAVHAQQGASRVVPASRDRADDARPRTPEQRLERTRSAMQRALFSSDEQIPITLIANFKAVNRDRNPESTKVFPATLVAPSLNGGEDRLAVNIRTRGHSRRAANTCTFAPLRIEFTGKIEGTVFEGHKSLKLGTHCRDVDSYEQYVYREFAAYKIFNRITPRSFRARLSTATYVDVSNNKPITTRAGLFLEDDDDVARRLDGEISELQNLSFGHVDGESMVLLSLFEYMIGNTDMSLAKLHNIILVRASNGSVYPVPYDFDYSGLVNARYAIPAKVLNLATVRERLYRGPCLAEENLAPYLTRTRGMRDAVVGLYDQIPNLDAGYRKDARGYLDQFFKIIEKPGDAKRAFIDGCKRSTM
ncbi:MAG: hypothetical protein ABL982_09055 [Vicinamibacterales bacterium]